jgi:hypothetical protein
VRLKLRPTPLRACCAYLLETALQIQQDILALPHNASILIEGLWQYSTAQKATVQYITA